MLNVFLHYEVNPYEPEAWVRNNISEQEYNAYESRRIKFIEDLKKVGFNGWIFGGGSNQIAKISINFQPLSFQDAKRMIESLLEKATNAIDQLI
jgi:hypothetical protein